MSSTPWVDKLVQVGNSLWLNLVSGDKVEFISEEHVVPKKRKSSKTSTSRRKPSKPETETKGLVKYRDPVTDQHLYAIFNTRKQVADYAQKLVDNINQVRSSQSGVVYV